MHLAAPLEQLPGGLRSGFESPYLGEALRMDFVKQFDQMAAAAEQTADELKRQVESMRDLVSTAMRRLSKKGKR
jgi:hypothetical protein